MKCIFVLFLIGIAKFAASQTDTLVINGVKFLRIVKTEKSEYNKKDTVLLLYRLENQTKKYLLKHYLYSWSSDCNNVFKDIGTMQVKSDSIIFETNHKQKGHDPIPTKCKQVYRVDALGKLKLIYDKELMGGKWIVPN
ncbi:MAG: hypothetical protein IPG89_10660 [Bacteroidetes bacterium]|nr:hypothetical protein [Bacteroidota bacterium]